MNAHKARTILETYLLHTKLELDCPAHLHPAHRAVAKVFARNWHTPLVQTRVHREAYHHDPRLGPLDVSNTLRTMGKHGLLRHRVLNRRQVWQLDFNWRAVA